MESSHHKIAIVGGTGALGMGLAVRWALAGHAISIGSRNPEAAAASAEEINRILRAQGRAATASGFGNKEAAQSSDIVVLAVPYALQKNVVELVRDDVAGKIFIDTTVPLVPPKVGTVQLPEEGSAAVATQRFLGAGVRVVSAFQTVAADKLRALDPLDCDVLVAGDDKDARAVVVGLVEAAGMRGFHAGPLANSAASEALTSVLITINRQFRCHAGIRIVGTE